MAHRDLKVNGRECSAASIDSSILTTEELGTAKYNKSTFRWTWVQRPRPIFTQNDVILVEEAIKKASLYDDCYNSLARAALTAVGNIEPGPRRSE